jgi:hypothetical protein
VTETFDHAQSPRLGQPTTVESTTVRVFTGTDLPEVAWQGQLIFRGDTKIMQVFNSELDAWEDVAGGEGGLLTFVGPIATIPTAQSAGDLWFAVREDDTRVLFRAQSAGANEISETEWVQVMSDVTAIPVEWLTGGEIDAGETIQLISPLVLEGEMTLIGKIEARGAGVVGMSGSDGFYVLGAIPVGGTEDNRPLLISFPVNGDPNIIAGQLTASTGLFTEGATFRGESGLETGAKLILHGEIRAPKNAPVLTRVHSSSLLEDWGTPRNSAWLNLYAYTGTKIVNVFNTPFGGDEYDYIYIAWNSSTGIADGQVYDYTSPFGSTYTLVRLVYNPFRSCFHELWAGPGYKYRIRTISSTYAFVNSTSVMDFEAYDPNRTPILGVDHDNGNVLIGFTSSMNGLSLLAFGTASNGAVSEAGFGTWGQAYSTTLAFADKSKYNYLAAGTFDFGAKRIVAQASNNPYFQVWNYGTSGTTSSELGINMWRTATENVSAAWWDGTNFKQIAPYSDTGGIIRKFEGGETIVTTNTYVHVAYTFYDDVGTAHETTLSPKSSLYITDAARARLSVSIDAFPTVPGDDSGQDLRRCGQLQLQAAGHHGHDLAGDLAGDGRCHLWLSSCLHRICPCGDPER